MAQLLVRDLDDELVAALKKRAAKHGRSVEAEHREILKAALQKRPVRNLKEQLLSWLDRLVRDHRSRILPITRRVADIWGPLNVPDKLPAIDGLLAATALAHDLTLVTRNVDDVSRSGVRLLNPFHRP